MLSLNVKLLKRKCEDHSNTEEIHPLHAAKENSTTLCHQKLASEFKTSALRSIIFHLSPKNIRTNVPMHICLNWQIGLIFSKVIETGKWRISTASKKRNWLLVHLSQQGPKQRFKKMLRLSRKQPASQRPAYAVGPPTLILQAVTSNTDIAGSHFQN